MVLLRSLPLRRLTVLCLSAAAVTCAISPKPEPPDADVTLDPGGLNVGSDDSRGAVIVLRAGPGSASPPGATVRVYNLDSDAPPVETAVAADGSFEVAIAGAEGDELRVQVIGEQDRSAPADVGGAGGSLTQTPDTAVGAPETPSTSDCVTSDPATELVIETSGVVTLTSSCAVDVQIDAPYPRVAQVGLIVAPEQTWPVTLPPAGSLSFTVQIDPATSFAEEILFVPVATEPPRRIAITVRTPD